MTAKRMRRELARPMGILSMLHYSPLDDLKRRALSTSSFKVQGHTEKGLTDYVRSEVGSDLPVRQKSE